MKPRWRKLHPSHPMVLEVARLRAVVRVLRAEENRRLRQGAIDPEYERETDAMCGEETK